MISEEAFACKPIEPLIGPISMHSRKLYRVYRGLVFRGS